jgi:EmrB/QacA subfamily drug resistance transporter
MEVLVSENITSRSQVILATVGVALTLLLAALDQTVVGVAMPRIVSELHGFEFYAWVVTAYLVMSTALGPVAGKLGDMFGRKPFLIAGIIGFMATSALCGAAQGMAELVAFRAAQGAFAGVLMATTFAVVADIFPPSQLSRMSGVFGAVFGVSSLVGPTLGGYLTDGPGWRWAFYVNIPVGLVASALVVTQLPRVRATRARLADIDWAGTGVLLVAIAPLLAALTLTRDHPWTSPIVLSLLAASAVLVVAFVFIERRAAHPVVPFELFRLNAFAVPAVISFFSAIGMFGTVTFVPLIFQGLLRTSATNSGQLLTPMMLAVVASSMVAGTLMARIPRYRFMGTVAIGLMVAGLVLLGHVAVGTNRWEITRDIIIVGAGLGVTFPLTIAVVQAGVPRRWLGVATSQVNFWRSLGGAIGTAVLGSVLTNRLPQHGLANSLDFLFLMAAGVAVVAVAATLFMREVPLGQAAEAGAEREGFEVAAAA